MRLQHARNENGFILVASLLTLLILMAVATLIYSVTTKDIRVSIRHVGEQKAFTAAEAGLHALIMASAATGGIGSVSAVTQVQVDSSGDTNSVYSYVLNTIPPAGVPASRPIIGFDIGSVSANWGQWVSHMTVTGENLKYGSSVVTNVGIGFGPVDVTTAQPAAGG